LYYEDTANGWAPCLRSLSLTRSLSRFSALHALPFNSIETLLNAAARWLQRDERRKGREEEEKLARLCACWRGNKKIEARAEIFLSMTVIKYLSLPGCLLACCLPAWLYGCLHADK
jgi:hypothetical protein